MKEWIIISGKGGTGKTSLTASFAALAKHALIADCDVDAADLHLILSPKICEQHDFISGREAVIRQQDCKGCGKCMKFCRFDAIHKTSENKFEIDPIACEGCGVCVKFCPVQAIDFHERLCGEWMISETRYGTMVHAQLDIAAENSGKLVSAVRSEARRMAEEKNCDLILVDGPPGIGCAVIASITGASSVLIVTEPTISGEHDLERVLALTKHFSIPSMICVNKWDLNPKMTELIETKARQVGAKVVGRIRYDASVTSAQIQEKAVVETDSPCAEDIRNIWNNIKELSI